MIAKILKPSFNFQAVYYNEQKVVEQKAELMAAVNFEGSLTAVNFWTKMIIFGILMKCRI